MAMSKSSFVMLRCAFHQTCKFSNSPEVYVYDIVNLFFPTLLQLAELQVVDFLWNESSSHNNMRVQCPSLGGFAKCETLFNLHHFGYIACSSACMPGSCRVTRSRIQGRLSGYSGYSGTVDTGEAGWGNCHFHMRGRRGENQTIEVFKYFKLSHEGREGEGENQTIDA